MAKAVLLKCVQALLAAAAAVGVGCFDATTSCYVASVAIRRQRQLTASRAAATAAAAHSGGGNDISATQRQRLWRA